jgi:hypothetical protein
MRPIPVIDYTACPFCQETNASTKIEEPHVFIRCGSCGAQGPGVYFEALPEDRAEAADLASVKAWTRWNGRLAATPR